MDNPVITKELKGRMRGRQGFTMLTVYLALISFFIGLVYVFLAGEYSSWYCNYKGMFPIVFVSYNNLILNLFISL